MKKTTIALWATAFAMSFLNPIMAQKLDSLETAAHTSKPTEYEIGGVNVTGVHFSDANALINIAGLKVGKKIKIPSSDIPNALKALWKLRLFDDVQIVKERTVGDVVFLEIQVKERPTLTTFGYVGVKKSERRLEFKFIYPWLSGTEQQFKRIVV